uniref:Uncharacterized protein n=1 Tax=Rhipicephalus zambeziensis TaxID=60191 RepID=A0A224Y503_9ACAR
MITRAPRSVPGANLKLIQERSSAAQGSFFMLSLPTYMCSTYIYLHIYIYVYMYISQTSTSHAARIAIWLTCFKTTLYIYNIYIYMMNIYVSLSSHTYHLNIINYTLQ